MFFIYDFTIATWIMLLKEKSEFLKYFKMFKAQLENERDLNINLLRSDRGGKCISTEFE